MSKKKTSPTPKTPNSKDESSYGFPTGMVAQTIRKIISPTLSNHDVECITVVLVYHLMLEEKINVLIYKWLTNHLPVMSGKSKKGLSVNDVAKDELNKYITRLDFVKKLDLIRPLGTLLWQGDSKGIFRDIHKINEARIEIVHRLDIKNIKFGNKSLATEDGLERFLDLAQQRLLNILDLIELIGE